MGRQLRVDPSHHPARANEPGFLERYGLDNDAWLHAVGHWDRGSLLWHSWTPFTLSRD